MTGTLMGAAAARRTPFVLLIVVLLGSGLIALLLLNSALNQGSFDLSRLEKRTTELTDEQQALQQEVDELSAPDALEKRARELGMVPGGSPAFLNPDGTVHGVPAPAIGSPVLFRPASAYGAPPRAYGAPDPAPLPAPRPPSAATAADARSAVPTTSAGAPAPFLIPYPDPAPGR